MALADELRSEPPAGAAEGAGRRARHEVEVEGHGQVVDHDVPGRQREVVHHRAAGDLDIDGSANPAIGAGHRVLHLVAPPEEVRDGVQLAGLRVAMRMRRVPAGQRGVEVARPDGVELTGQLVGDEPGLDDGEDAAGVTDDVGVGREVGAGGVRPRPRGLAESLRHVAGAHPAVAVPLGLAVAEAHAVHHPGAEEPVVRGRIGCDDRVGAIAQIATVQVVRDRPGDLQVGRGDLLVHGCEVALEVSIAGSRHPTLLP
jgi:hypothetical protein